MNDYDKQAADFLAKHNLILTKELSNSKGANWQPHGNHYIITLDRGHDPIHFDFFGSINDMNNGVDPSDYEILSTVSAELDCPETFGEYLDEFGVVPEGSYEATETMWKSWKEFSDTLHEFLTEDEKTDVREIV